MDFLVLVGSSLWFFLPALFANQCPGFARKLNLLWSKAPVWESGLGPGKTWGAYYVGPLGALFILYVQRQFPTVNTELGLFNYDQALLLPSISLGLGAILGDHVKSFIKRQLEIPPGTKWLPDRIDFAIGAIIGAIPILGWIGWQRSAIILAF